MEPEKRIGDALDYCAFILSLDTWGHGPVQVAECVKAALEGHGLPEDCLAWLEARERRDSRKEGRA